MALMLVLIEAPFALLTFCFAIELFAGLRPLRRAEEAGAAGGKAVIVVPAHDEEAILPAHLDRLQLAAEGVARVLVVADNCSDATAAIARQLGADVIERHDRQRRGKGFALDFARSHLRSQPPDIIVIVDADCSIDHASIKALIAECAARMRPCQAKYVQVPKLGAPPKVHLSAFAFFVRNVIRQRGLQRITGHVHLVGTGMAFPWLLFEDADLATDNIVEDLELGLELADRGAPPLLVDGALVLSDTASDHNTLDQRRRWEGGFVASARRWAPRILRKAILTGKLAGIWSALSLCIPPFALLLLGDLCALLLVATATLVLGTGYLPILILLCAVATAGVGLILAWLAGGSEFVPARALAQAPLYVLWKMPLYFGLVRHGAPKNWVRTGRE